MKPRKYIWLLLAAALLLAAGCEPEVAVSQIQLSEETYMMNKGDRALLEVVLMPDNAISGLQLSWSSDNEEAVTVSDIGLIRAVDVGTAVVTVRSASGAAASCTVTVNPVIAESIALSKKTVTFDKGDTETLTVSFSPEDTTDRTVTWTSSAPAIVSVKDGVITAQTQGTADIKAETANGLTAICKVTVNPVAAEGITLSNGTLTLPLGEEHTLTAVVSPEDTNDKTVTWSTDNETSVTVDGGKLKAIATGSAVIKAETHNGLSATCTVTVPIVDAESITLDKTALTLDKNGKHDFTVTYSPEGTTETAITWSSSTEGIVSFDGNSLTALTPGDTVVTATAESGVTAECTVHVNDVDAAGITLDRTELKLDKAETAQLNVTFDPADTTDTTLTWSTSSAAVATVKDGLVEAVAPGTATITATTVNGIKATCTVTVNPVLAESIALNVTEMTLDKEATLQLYAAILPEDTTVTDVTWTTSSDAVATVSDGLVTAVEAGEATITAETSNGLTATCRIKVNPVLVESIRIKNDRLNIMMGSSYDVEVIFTPANTSDRTFTVVPSDSGIVSVDGGTIRTIAPGKTTVTVKSGTASTEIPVTVADYFGHNNNDLKAQITEYGTGSEKKLTIAGKLSYSDFQYLASLTDLETLDLSLLDVYALPQYGLFGAKNIRTVILPEGITEIPYSFFYSSPISSVNIPASVTKIDGYAFGATPQLESVTLPDGLSEIGDFAFWGSGLTSITVPGSVSILGNGIFYECAQLKSAVLSEGVTEIGSNTFYYCKILESIRLPSTLTSIGPSAFQLCGLGGIVIPEKVASIGPLAFYGNMEMRSAELPDGLQRIESQTFASCTKLRKLNLPSDLVYIGPAAFRESPVTPEDGILKIPSGVTEIGDSAFGFLYSMDQDSFKSKITEIQLNEGLTKIGQHAFDNMPNLTKIEFPSSLTTLSDTAIPAWVTDVTFRGTTVPSVSMTYTEAADPVPAAPDTAWMKNVDVHVPESVLEAWKTGEWGSGGYDGYGEKITYFDPAKMTAIPKD